MNSDSTVSNNSEVTMINNDGYIHETNVSTEDVSNLNH